MNYSPRVSIAILDYNRKNEAIKLLESIKTHAKFDHEIVYLSNGGAQDYVLDFYKNGQIDKLILNKNGNGCGLGTRQLFQSCMSDWVIYVQVDQFLYRELNEIHISQMIDALSKNKEAFYVDLANNQGQGRFSERAGFFDRKRYLSMPRINEIVGGPGPFADKQWTENYVQEYMKESGLTFFTGPECFFFADNGKWSHRHYPCGGETLHSTDQKVLRIIKSLKRKYNFPNLNLNDAEWSEVLSGAWPIEGKIPEADKAHSFHVWN